MAEPGTEISLPTDQEAKEAIAPRDSHAERRAFFATARARIMASVLGISLLTAALSAACEASPKGTKAPTETPVATYPAGVDTPTKTPTQTPTVSESTPTHTPTPENSQQEPMFNLIVDPEVAQNPSRPITEHEQAIMDILSLIPLPEKITVRLIPGTNDSADTQNAEIKIGADHVSIETEKFEITHEGSHILDIEKNEQYLKKFLNESQIAELKILREKALSDPVWGRDYPDKNKIMLGKINAKPVPRPGDSIDHIAQGTDLYANGFFIKTSRGKDAQGNEIPGPDPFENELKDAYLLINQLAENDHQNKIYETFSDFITARKDIFDQIAQTNPLAAEAVNSLNEDAKTNLFSPENTVWSSSTPSKAYLTAGYEKDWIKIIPNFMRLELLNKHHEGEIYALLVKECDEEKFAELFKVTVYGKIDTPLGDYIAFMRESFTENGHLKAPNH